MPRCKPIIPQILTLIALWFSAAARAQDPAATQQQYYIGVAVEKISPTTGHLLKLSPDQGMLVLQVIPKSPAADADLQPNDLLISLNGIPLKSQQQLAEIAYPKQAGDAMEIKPVTVEFIRQLEHHTIALTPALRPENLVVSGAHGNILSPSSDQTIADANGNLHQIGTGVIVDSRNTNALFARSISQITHNKQTVILSQEADAAGHVKNTITVSGKTYLVDAAHLENLPAEVRDLVSLFPVPATTEPAPDTQAQQIKQLQEQLQQKSKQIEEMQRQLQKLIPPASNNR